MDKIFDFSNKYSIKVDTDEEGIYHVVYTFTDNDDEVTIEGSGLSLYDAIDDVVEKTAKWCDNSEEDNQFDYEDEIEKLNHTVDCYECKMNELLEENEDLQITIAQLKKENENLKKNSFTANDFLNFLNDRR